MKHLVTVLAVFLLMGSQTLAQETVSGSENIENLPGFVMSGKPVVCGPMRSVFDKIAEFGEVPAAAWIDSERGGAVMLYINVNTGTTTVIERIGEMMCILSQGMGGAIISLPKKIKGMPIKHLTF
jgi:hypothetical protein